MPVPQHFPSHNHPQHVPQTELSPEALIAQAKKFVWQGDYAAAIGMLRKALFETSRIGEGRVLQARSVHAIWEAIETHFAERLMKTIEANCAQLEKVARREQGRWNSRGLPTSLVEEHAKDMQAVHMMAFRMGQTHALVHALCDSDRERITERDLIKVQAVLYD